MRRILHGRAAPGSTDLTDARGSARSWWDGRGAGEATPARARRQRRDDRAVLRRGADHRAARSPERRVDLRPRDRRRSVAGLRDEAGRGPHADRGDRDDVRLDRRPPDAHARCARRRDLPGRCARGRGHRHRGRLDAGRPGRAPPVRASSSGTARSSSRRSGTPRYGRRSPPAGEITSRSPSAARASWSRSRRYPRSAGRTWRSSTRIACSPPGREGRGRDAPSTRATALREASRNRR